MLCCITQDDVINRRVFDRNHRSYVPNFGCYIKAEVNGKMKYFAVSRQMVLFAVERRKAWRMLQSKAGVANKDYLAQKSLLAKLDKGELSRPTCRPRPASCSKRNWRPWLDGYFAIVAPHFGRPAGRLFCLPRSSRLIRLQLRSFPAIDRCANCSASGSRTSCRQNFLKEFYTKSHPTGVHWSEFGYGRTVEQAGMPVTL